MANTLVEATFAKLSDRSRAIPRDEFIGWLGKISSAATTTTKADERRSIGYEKNGGGGEGNGEGVLKTRMLSVLAASVVEMTKRDEEEIARSHDVALLEVRLAGATERLAQMSVTSQREARECAELRGALASLSNSSSNAAAEEPSSARSSLQQLSLFPPPHLLKYYNVSGSPNAMLDQRGRPRRRDEQLHLSAAGRDRREMIRREVATVTTSPPSREGGGGWTSSPQNYALPSLITATTPQRTQPQWSPQNVSPADVARSSLNRISSDRYKREDAELRAASASGRGHDESLRRYPLPYSFGEAGSTGAVRTSRQ